MNVRNYLGVLIQSFFKSADKMFIYIVWQENN